jgi:two-component system, chemotaxis family, response regulator Rcp1
MDTVRVLMVEDNPGDVVLVREALRKAGLHYEMTVVKDGVEATQFLAGGTGKARPDLLILDLKLPRKTGREVLAEILSDPSLDKMPTVILSSSRSELELARALKLPQGSYMLKPSTFKGYLSLVASIEAYRQEFLAGAKGPL